MDELSPQELSQIQAFFACYGKCAEERHRTIVDGKVVNQIQGTKHGIHLSAEDEKKIEPMSIEVHNHPRFGGCFSPEDIVACKAHKSRMIVVNGYGDIFYMRTNDNDKLEATKEFLSKLRKEYYDKSYTRYSKEIVDAVYKYNSFDTRTKQKNRQLYYWIQREISIAKVERLAERYGFTFRHFKMSGEEVVHKKEVD